MIENIPDIQKILVDLITSSKYGLVILDASGKILWRNKIFAELFSENTQNFIEIVEEEQNLNNSIIAYSNKTQSFQIREIYNKSIARWLLINCYPFEIKNEKFFLVLLDDTTERKKVFESYISQLEILDNVEDGIYSTDFENRIQYWNRGAEKIYGFTAQEVVGKIVNKDFFLYNDFDEETKNQITIELEKYRTYSFIREEFRKDGTKIWVEGNVTLLTSSSDKPIGLIYIVRDITSKRASELLNLINADLQKALRDITANLLSDFSYTDLSFQIVKKCKELTEAKFASIIRSDEISNEIVEFQSEVFLDEATKIDLLNITSSIKNWLQLNKKHLSSIDNDGNEIIESLRTILKLNHFIISPCIIKNEVKVFILVGAEEFSYPNFRIEIVKSFASLYSFIKTYFNKKLLQESLEQKLNQAHKYELASKIISGVVHDFKNILLGIKNAEELIKKINTDKAINTYIMEIDKLIKRGINISKNLMEIGRPLQPQKIEFYAHDFLNDIVSLSQHILPSSINITKEYPDTLPKLYADYNQLHQVFMNLLINAKDAMDNVGTITISANEKTISEKEFINNPQLKSGTYLVISITDTGEGIPPELISKIFGPYFTTKSPEKGTGLGLFISQNIISKHNGYIEVQSTLGKGTTFSIYLPILKEETVEEPVKIPTKVVKEATILIVDDEETIRSLLAEMLNYNGYNTIQAESGEEAIRIVNQNIDKIDLIILDYFLKDINGDFILEKIKSLKKDLPVFIATGVIEEDIVKKLNEQKADKIIEKPYDFEKLLQYISNYIKISVT